MLKPCRGDATLKMLWSAHCGGCCSGVQAIPSLLLISLRNMKMRFDLAMRMSTQHCPYEGIWFVWCGATAISICPKTTVSPSDLRANCGGTTTPSLLINKEGLGGPPHTIPHTPLRAHQATCRADSHHFRVTLSSSLKLNIPLPTRWLPAFRTSRCLPSSSGNLQWVLLPLRLRRPTTSHTPTIPTLHIHGGQHRLPCQT